MDEVKGNQFSWQRLAVTTVIVMVTAAVTFGITWFILDKSGKESDEASNQLRVSLQKQIDDLRVQLKTTDDTDSAVNPQKYSNAEFGFQLTFPVEWEGYKLLEKTIDGTTQTWYVELPTTDSVWAESTSTSDAGYVSIFAFSAYTEAQWTEEQSGPVKSTYLGKVGSYTFGYSRAQSAPENMTVRFDDIKSIVATFKATE